MIDFNNNCYKWNKKEAELLEKQLKELRMKLDAGIRKETSRKGGEKGRDPLNAKLFTIENMLEKKLLDLYKRREKMECMIDNIKEDELRLLTRLRCIDQLSWEEIGFELNMDRRTASRKYSTLLPSYEREDQNIDKSKRTKSGNTNFMIDGQNEPDKKWK